MAGYRISDEEERLIKGVLGRDDERRRASLLERLVIEEPGEGLKGLLDEARPQGEEPAEDVRARVERWYRETVSNRKDNPNDGPAVFILARVHEDDLAGQFRPDGAGFEHLHLPTHYEGQD